jgi:hypothetical protein
MLFFVTVQKRKNKAFRRHLNLKKLEFHDFQMKDLKIFTGMTGSYTINGNVLTYSKKPQKLPAIDNAC